MKSAIIINLDYEGHDANTCKRVWTAIDARMQEAGFAKHKRLFTTQLDRDSASMKAKIIVDQVENDLADEGIIVFDIISEFYCFAYQQLNDLLDPNSNPPQLDFVDTTAFKAVVVNRQT